MSQVVLKQLTKAFNQQHVIEDLSLTIPSGSFTVLVGPSGCGKSTTLRMIAGLEKPTSGEIWIGDQLVTAMEPGQRDIAMVFQNYALYPTMSVKENIEFGLKNRKVPKAEREKLIEEISETVGLADYLKRKPSELSGGQRQRVALARAMVKKPQVFLMDEPLSNLDAQLRQQMRMELMELHRKLGSTFIYVTHDQVEAMSMGDQIVIMNKGHIQQAASPFDVYHHPRNLFVAGFIGSPPMNLIPAQKSGKSILIGHEQMIPLDGRTGVEQLHVLGIRPEKVILHAGRQHMDHPIRSVVVDGTIVSQEMLGAETIYYLETKLGKIVAKCFGYQSFAEQPLKVELKLSDCVFFDQQGNSLLEPSFKPAAGEEIAIR